MGETRNSFGFAPPRKSRNCVTCGQSYKPGSAHSKYCLVCRKVKEHEWREKAKVKSRDLNRVRYQLDKGYRTERLAQAAKNREKTRLKVIGHYSRQSFQCMCCGEPERDFLTVDHIDGDTVRESRSKGIPRSGRWMYLWLIRNNFPPGFQVLCANCNIAKGHRGVCPHKGTERLF